MRDRTRIRGYAGCITGEAFDIFSTTSLPCGSHQAVYNITYEGIRLLLYDRGRSKRGAKSSPFVHAHKNFNFYSYHSPTAFPQPARRLN